MKTQRWSDQAYFSNKDLKRLWLKDLRWLFRTRNFYWMNIRNLVHDGWEIIKRNTKCTEKTHSGHDWAMKDQKMFCLICKIPYYANNTTRKTS